MADRKNGKCAEGVKCNVFGCEYNSSDYRCTADHIKVENEQAESKAETFCSTFRPKSTMM